MEVKTIIVAAALSVAPGLLHAQWEFKLADKDFQIHSFASQGFLYTNDNNYLSMPTSKGSFAFTDGGANISTNITDKFHVGAQVYVRNIGELGKWRPELDWAFGSYQFKSWFGIRVGKVKTVQGLYNDTQDMGFLHTWAILPQSMYPLDLRASTISHTGGDVFGTIVPKRFGEFTYTGYAGKQSFDRYGGYVYGLTSLGINLTSFPATQIGGDLRWSGLVRDLLFGTSYLQALGSADGTIQVAPTVRFPLAILSESDNTATFYVQYKPGNLTLDGEYRREIFTGTSKTGPLPASRFGLDERGWYASAAYRVSKRLELGAYHSRFYPLWDQDHAPASNHMFDTVATAKIGLIGRWDLKIEGHFMDGYGTSTSFRGFYPQNNPDGLKPKTNMLVIRTAWNI
jgi:hypothetical protein